MKGQSFNLAIYDRLLHFSNMARKGRVEYAGAIYHVMSRGNGGQAIYTSDDDRFLFLNMLGEVCLRHGWKIHAYVLMSNHYHLLLETPEPNLVSGMKWLLGTYTQRYNARHQRWGHLFQGRYKAIAIQRDEGDYFAIVSDYIHLNPVRAGLVPEDEGLETYRWSSYPAYAYKRVQKPNWLYQPAVLGAYDLDLNAHGRRLYRRHMALRVARERGYTEQQRDEVYQPLRRGWYLGGKAFKDFLTERFDADHGDAPYEADQDVKNAHNEYRAKELLQAGLKHFGIHPSDLAKRKKNCFEKRVIGHLIKQKTTVSLEWLSENLAMGTRSGVSRHCSSLDDLVQRGVDVDTHLSAIEKQQD